MIPGMAIHSFFRYRSSPHHIFFPLSIWTKRGSRERKQNAIERGRSVNDDNNNYDVCICLLLVMRSAAQLMCVVCLFVGRIVNLGIATVTHTYKSQARHMRTWGATHREATGMSKQKSTKREYTKTDISLFPQANGLYFSFCGFFVVVFVGWNDMGAGRDRKSRRAIFEGFLLLKAKKKKSKNRLFGGRSGGDGIYWRRSSLFYCLSVILCACAMGGV